MTLCPVAIAVGCRKCPVFSICPLKTVIGDQAASPEAPAPGTTASTTKAGPGAAKRRGGRKSR